MRTPIFLKISFWLVIIGVAALSTPNPAWPEWVGRMVLSTGIALAITSIGVAIFKRNKDERDEDSEG